MSESHKTTLERANAVREWMRGAYKTPPKFEVYRMMVEGEFLATVGEITLKDEGGRDVLHAYCDVWSFRDGLLDRLHAFVLPGSLRRPSLIRLRSRSARQSVQRPATARPDGPWRCSRSAAESLHG